jgi:hypothetical protein
MCKISNFSQNSHHQSIYQSIINDLRCPYPLIVIKDAIRAPSTAAIHKKIIPVGSCSFLMGLAHSGTGLGEDMVSMSS